jgi:hypothetical protein
MERMKKMSMVVLAGVTSLFVLNGCGESIPNPLTEEECETLERKIIQTDMFIEKIKSMNDSQVEEYLVAVSNTAITLNSEKGRVLKDANKRMVKLEAEAASAGCEIEYKKK